MKSVKNVKIVFCSLIIIASLTSAQEKTKMFKDSENKFMVNVPKNWKHIELNDEANIEIGNEKDETYFISICESKDDFAGWNLEKHSRVTLAQILISVRDPNIEGPSYFEIDGNTAVQYKLAGEVTGLNVIYLHTTIESKNYFNQLLAWTMKSRYSKNEKLLKSVVNSFRVLDEE